MSKEINIEEAIESLNKFIKIVGSKEYRDDNGWNGYYNTEMRYLGQAIETVIRALEDYREDYNHRCQLAIDRKKQLANSISKDKIKEKIEKLQNELKYIGCGEDCSKCFDKEGKPLYRGSSFTFCYAYHQIKILQELLEKEK